jgi:uncharacterized ParB-like nuclease family protein
VFPCPWKIINGGQDLDAKAVHERHINRIRRPLQEGLDYSRVNSHRALFELCQSDTNLAEIQGSSYLDIERGTCHGERRIA